MKTFLVVLLFSLSCWLVVSKKSLLLRKKISVAKSPAKQLIHDPWFCPGKRVAFGASLGRSGHTCGYYRDVTLIYKKVHYNSGHYNRYTGIFTAPVSGVYYFSFSGHHHAHKPMGLQLMKNGWSKVSVYRHNTEKRYGTATNGMVLKLAKRDRVYIRLRRYTCVYDSYYNHNTFSGFLLFPLYYFW